MNVMIEMMDLMLHHSTDMSLVLYELQLCRPHYSFGNVSNCWHF